MKLSTKDQIQGKFDELKGKAKEKTGHLIGNTRLETEGQVQNLSGKMQQKAAQIEKVLEK